MKLYDFTPTGGLKIYMGRTILVGAGVYVIGKAVFKLGTKLLDKYIDKLADKMAERRIRVIDDEN